MGSVRIEGRGNRHSERQPLKKLLTTVKVIESWEGESFQVVYPLGFQRMQFSVQINHLLCHHVHGPTRGI